MLLPNPYGDLKMDSEDRSTQKDTSSSAVTSSLSDLIARLEKATGIDKCWSWPGKTDHKGRGRVSVNGKTMLAHRAVWERVVAPIPEGKMLCHRCDNMGCVNPAHMYVGTHADNMRDMKDRRRYFQARDPERVRKIAQRLGSSNTWCKGEANATAKLTREQAATIRVDPRSSRVIAEEFGVHASTVQRIKSGALWS